MWDYLPQSEQCNVCFDCLIYYDSSSALADNRCTWYEAHFRNGLRISVLDDDLSQAQLAQVEELLDIDIAYDYLFLKKARHVLHTADSVKLNSHQ